MSLTLPLGLANVDEESLSTATVRSECHPCPNEPMIGGRRLGRRPRRDRPSRGDDGLATLIPYRNPKSLIAYYCGVFGLIPILGFILAP